MGHSHKLWPVLSVYLVLEKKRMDDYLYLDPVLEYGHYE